MVMYNTTEGDRSHEKKGMGGYDPWEVPEFEIKEKSWQELTTAGKIKRVLWDYIGRFVLLLGLLYLFICSLDFLSSAFRLLGGKTAGKVFAESDLLTNPVAGLMIGVLVTVLVQSSSTSTSIVITMVGALIIPPKDAVFIIMGANIGTTVTNTIVSLAQSGNRDEFRRAFGGAVVHDMFNWLAVAVFLPLEVITGAIFGEGFLFWMTGKIVEAIGHEPDPDADIELLKVITSPFTKLVIQIDKKVITKIAKGDESAEEDPILKTYCGKKEITTDKLVNQTVNGSWMLVNETKVVKGEPRCEALFSQWDMSDTAAGIIILIVALVILCVCLVLIVKLLHSILKGKIALIIKKFINADFPGVAKHFTGYVAILLGAGITFLVQSSSIFTSAITPLVGVGVIHISRMYPLTLGANIGTTTTGILAALTQDEHFNEAFQIALVHFFFNICGILVWYPIPFMRNIPISLAMKLGNTTADYRWFALIYLFLIFFIIPALVFGLSLAGWYVLLAVGGPLLIFVIFIAVINVLQEKKPGAICCEKLRTWDGLPLWMHSFEPMDRVLRKICFCACCQRTFCDKGEDPEDVGMMLSPPGYTEKNGRVHGKGMNNPSYDTDPSDNTDIANAHI